MQDTPVEYLERNYDSVNWYGAEVCWCSSPECKEESRTIVPFDSRLHISPYERTGVHTRRLYELIRCTPMCDRWEGYSGYCDCTFGYDPETSGYLTEPMSELEEDMWLYLGNIVLTTYDRELWKVPLVLRKSDRQKQFAEQTAGDQ